jgi:tartrate-resistant acid phosphatase type 5
MKMPGLFLALFLSFVGRPADAATPPVIPQQAVRFVAFGDAGSGSGGQAAVAQAMSEVCVVRGCDFAVMLGDNFYPDGVRSARDPQFETKFEEPYEALDLPFFAVLGNHDNGGNGSRNRDGEYQVEYAKREDRPSDRWRMPARYYKFSAPLASAVRAEPVEARPLVDFFALDSTPLAPYVDDPDPKYKPERYGATQLVWLQQALRDSKAVWKIAFAHHPYVSDGGHGSAGRYLVRGATSRNADGKLWRDLLEKSICPAGVDLMLQAHDHNLEWLKPVAACGKTEFVTSGAGGAQLTPLFNNSQPMYWQQAGRFGFFWFEVKPAQLKGAAFALDEDAELPRNEDGQPKPTFERTLQKKL